MSARRGSAMRLLAALPGLLWLVAAAPAAGEVRQLAVGLDVDCPYGTFT